MALFLDTADWLCFLYKTVILIYFSFLYFFSKNMLQFQSQKTKGFVIRKEKEKGEKLFFLPGVILES